MLGVGLCSFSSSKLFCADHGHRCCCRPWHTSRRLSRVTSVCGGWRRISHTCFDDGRVSCYNYQPSGIFFNFIVLVCCIFNYGQNDNIVHSWISAGVSSNQSHLCDWCCIYRVEFRAFSRVLQFRLIHSIINMWQLQRDALRSAFTYTCNCIRTHQHIPSHLLHS